MRYRGRQHMVSQKAACFCIPLLSRRMTAFDGFAALSGANITVPSGGVYGLVGPNGAGKSTIIRHLTGIYRPDSSSRRLWELTRTVVPCSLTSDYIVRGRAGDITSRLERHEPLMLEALPLSLEEIFIYELGGEQYAVKCTQSSPPQQRE